MKNKKMFLDLFKIKFPVTAIVSISHRISGVLMFLSVPIWLFVIHVSLIDKIHFQSVTELLSIWYLKVIAYLSLLPWIFHLLAGLRHLLMDLGFMEGLCGAKFTAYSVFALFVLFTFVLGAIIWI